MVQSFAVSLPMRLPTDHDGHRDARYMQLQSMDLSFPVVSAVAWLWSLAYLDHLPRFPNSFAALVLV